MRKHFKPSLPFLLLAGAMTLSATGCSDTGITHPVEIGTPKIPAAHASAPTLVRLRFSPDSIVLIQGTTGVLILTGKMSDSSTISVTDASWGATTNGIVGVNTLTGELAALGVGKTVLVATRGAVQTRAVVEVRPASLAHARIKPDAACIRVGYSYQYVMHTYDEAGIEVAPGATAWTVDDPTMATIDANGILHALKGGHTTVRGMARGMSDDAPVVLDPAPLGLPMTCQ